ncbi:hypothetical protein [Daejeonella sp.]|uniref:hypothetical protein n=1 Tax=Daejeonella sp. TaxID=2805397 RepID=UPI0030C55B24
MSVRVLIIILMAFISEVKAQKYPYRMQGDIGLLIGKQVLPVPGVQVFNGVRIDKWSSEAGITVGADIYRQLTILPVSGSIRWMPLPEKALTPYLGFSAGYGLAWINRGTEEKDYRGGAVYNPSIGLRIKTKTKARVNFTAGFKHQRAAFIERRFDNLGREISIVTEEYSFGRISLNFGVGF